MKTILTLAALTCASVASAEPNTFSNCFTLEELGRVVAERYGESIQMVLGNDIPPNVGGQTILAGNQETGSWTIFVVGPRFPGLACILQAGEGFGPELFQPQPPLRPEIEG